jgi:hypothetical protein
MALSLTVEQILALAPDASSAKAGKQQATAKKWPSLGCNDQAVWGECQGSGKKPYQIKVDLHEMAYHCTCPSRKLPCKHTLGLLLLLHDQPAIFKQPEPPPWVDEWLIARAERARKREEKQQVAQQKAADPKAQAKRAGERHARTAAGLQELELWLRDLVRQGLAAAQSQPRQFWEAPAQRLIDAQAPGIARLLRQMAAVPTSGEGWADRLLVQIGRLYLLIEGFKRLESLPAETQADMHTVLGWTQNQDELLSRAGVRDCWLVVGQRVEEQDRLQAQFTWLWGSESRRAALVLDFAHGSNPLDKSLVPGLWLDAELVFFPGAYPLRALIKSRRTVPDASNNRSGYADIAAATDAYSDALARFPWLEQFPMLLQGVIPLHSDGTWLICDRANCVIHCAPEGTPYWHLLAKSGGHPVDIFGEWDGQCFWPMGVWT